MTEEHMRIAIAESVGWKLLDTEEEVMFWPGGIQTIKTKRWFYKTAQTLFGGTKEEDLPNYPRDLNAMHEVEKTLSHTPHSPGDICDEGRYRQRLIAICGPYNFYIATALQRAKAYCQILT